MNSHILFKILISIFILNMNNILGESIAPRELLTKLVNENQTDFHNNQIISEELIEPKEPLEELKEQNQTEIYKNHLSIECTSDIILDNSMVLSSQHYMYEEDSGHIWRIIVPEDNHQILVQFEYIITFNNTPKNCEENYIEIRNGLSSKSPLIQRSCHDLPMRLYSQGRELYIRLVNHDSNSSLQFAVYLNNELDVCHPSVHNCEHHCINTFQGYTCSCDEGFQLDSDGKSCKSIYAERGTINHEMCNNTNNAENFKCLWKILAPPNYRIVLEFVHFNLDEEHNDFYNCSKNNHISIIEKLESNEAEIEGPYCGSILPGVRLSKSNEIGVEFKTNDNTLNSEFVIYYSIVKDECAFNNGGCQHGCQKTINSFKCCSCAESDTSDYYE